MCWTMSSGRTWGAASRCRWLYAATAWALGPMLGVWLLPHWAPAPFLVAGAFALALLAAFWVLRLGNGKQITRAKGPAVNPLGYLGRFFSQPRLIAGWLFAVIAVLRLVGLCRLPADLLHRGGSGRQGRRHRPVDDQRAAVRGALPAEPAGAPDVGAPVGAGWPSASAGRCSALAGLLALLPWADGGAGHGGVGLPGHAGCGGRAAVPDVGQARPSGPRCRPSIPASAMCRAS